MDSPQITRPDHVAPSDRHRDAGRARRLDRPDRLQLALLWLPTVALGIATNWFGDSLDGSLARYRNEERPRFGFLVDHTCDLFAQILLIVAFGLSPFLSLVAALVVLLCYLLFSAYTSIRAAAHHVHQMSYIGVGATEFRILMIFWAFAGSAAGLREPLVNGLSGIDIAILGLGLIAVVGLGAKAVKDARQVAVEEGPSISSPTAVAAETGEADCDLSATEA